MARPRARRSPTTRTSRSTPGTTPTRSTSAKYYNTYSDYHNGTVTATGEYAITYGNDAFGRMVMRTAVVGQGGTTTTSTENFIYCGQNIVLVLNGSGQVIECNLTGPAADEVFATEAVATVLSARRRPARSTGT